MKIGLISDVHSNLEALEEVLRDIEKEGVEKIHFLGAWMYIISLTI